MSWISGDTGVSDTKAANTVDTVAILQGTYSPNILDSNF
jgi:hypothetical protein